MSDPKLPPLFNGHDVKAPLAAFEEACRSAQRGVLGAGDLVWSRNTSRAELALILEPEVVRGRALQMAPLAAVAAAETIGFLAPPQVAVEFRWPDRIVVNGGDAGRIALAIAECGRDAVPDWLVIGVSIDVTSAAHTGEPGERPDQTALREEGAGELTRSDVIEAMAPRLLAWLNTWTEDGFRPIHEQWLFRALGRAADFTIDGVTGRVLGLDEEANLLLGTPGGQAKSVSFLPHVLVMPARRPA